MSDYSTCISFTEQYIKLINEIHNFMILVKFIRLTVYMSIHNFFAFKSMKMIIYT
jgi:hypothetical protein